MSLPRFYSTLRSSSRRIARRHGWYATSRPVLHGQTATLQRWNLQPSLSLRSVSHVPCSQLNDAEPPRGPPEDFKGEWTLSRGEWKLASATSIDAPTRRAMIDEHNAAVALAVSEEGNFKLAIRGLCLRFISDGAGGALHQAIVLAAAAARKAKVARVDGTGGPQARQRSSQLA